MTDFDPHSYTITIKRVVEDGESLFKASVKELPHVTEYGDSYEEVYELAVDAINVLHEMADDMGHRFPDPSIEDERFSGRVTLRMPKSLHRAVAATAEIEGVSLNQFLVATIAERVGSGNFYTKLVGDRNKPMFGSVFTELLRTIWSSDAKQTTSDVMNSISELSNISVQKKAATTESTRVSIPCVLSNDLFEYPLVFSSNELKSQRS